MTPDAPPPPPPDPVIGRATRVVAIVGGCLSIATATLVTLSVLGRWLGFGSINGDFELVQMGVALSVFCFLPLSQARRGNTITTLAEDEARRWQQATQPVIDAWVASVKDKNLDGTKLLESFRGLVAKYDKTV